MYEPVASFTACAAVAYSSYVAGGSVMPAAVRMSSRYRLPIGPTSCGIAQTSSAGETWFHAHST